MLFQASLISGLLAVVGAQSPQLTVETNTGTITGIINGTTPNVRQFLSIPFGQPPVGDLRWEAPVAITTNSSTQIDATQYPKSCPQIVSSIKSVYNQVIVPWIPARYDQNSTAGASLQTSSEDCLYLAVWTPANATNSSSLPVIFFITGGAFQTNGVDVPAQIPNHWVERTQSHIVVTINYRLNIFGFPVAPGLENQNLGLLDQRLALEWVRDNIEAFGGDPERITLWGQSAGAISTDYQTFAFPDDPIVTGFFAQSGSVFLDIGSHDTTYSNFTFVAEHFGCSSSDNSTLLACMRNVSSVDIENFLADYGDSYTSPGLTFGPFADDKVVWSNYTEQYEKGAYANLPIIYTTCAMEGEALVPYPKDPYVSGPNQTLALETTLYSFLCPAALSSKLRSQQNDTTPIYRNIFAGNFSNVSPLFWMGAYHASDLSMYFGTHQDLTGPNGQGSTQREFEVSDMMQDYLLEFASTKGYVSAWPEYQSGNLLVYGNGTEVVQTVSLDSVESICASYTG